MFRKPLFVFFAFVGAAMAEEDGAKTGPPTYTIQLPSGPAPAPAPSGPKFTARFTAVDLMPLFEDQVELLPMPLRRESTLGAMRDALERVSMAAVVETVTPVLTSEYADRFDAGRDIIFEPVPEEKQITIETEGLPEGSFTGPKEEIVGFLVHQMNETSYVEMAIRVAQVARQLLDTGEPTVDRTSPQYYEMIARTQAQAIADSRQQASAIRQRIAEALGAYTEEGEIVPSQAQWVKESRRFSYVVQDGKFIEKLRPLVEQINREVAMAGFDAPQFPIDEPGIHFDPDLKDVEILLPRPLLEAFLSQADVLERRMAEDSMISIEVVRLTDRDIQNSAVASRLNASFQGVHDPSSGFNQDAVVRQVGINALTAIANRELSIVNAEAIAQGLVPSGTEPISLAPFELPSVIRDPSVTTIGNSLSIGADDVFFDGRQQSFGFSYIGPDGVEHVLSIDVVDSLRRFWERIERNLIVHKIRKTSNRSTFTVPIGPDTKTFEGIAALISQQNQNLVVTTGDALSELSATAGTWLVINDFEITPIPGSSTALSDAEIREIRERVLMTMLLRDPMVPVDVKTRLVEMESRGALSEELDELRRAYADRALRPGRGAQTFGALFESRFSETQESASVEKKERNSKISLTFYSSQGTILSNLGVTALGDQNDLTSFTTQLSPNRVTPISSFFTKQASNTKDTSSMTGLAKGENEVEEKTMTHLVVRARFPTEERERKDRDEGRFLGYFQLPMGEDPLSSVNLPFLSSSEHPLERLAQIRPGLMFPSLDEDRVLQPWLLFNPNRIVGDVPEDVWKACTTRMLFNQRIISESPHANQALVDGYRQRFIIEVRSLLEFDEDLFDAPNIALRNMDHWNTPHRIVLALNNSSERFAYHRLIMIIDELGKQLIDKEFVDDRLAVAEPDFWKSRRLRPLTDREIRDLRRDVAAHFLRIEELYGDAFLEAIGIVLGLNTYESLDHDVVTDGPFHGYEHFVMFDRSKNTYKPAELIRAAHDDFLLLRRGGYKGKLFERSLEFVEHVPDMHRPFFIVGTDILGHRESPTADAKYVDES